MAELPINYGDSGRIARDKINDSFDALVEQVEGYEPHIVDGIWWIGETNTGVKAEGDNVQMKVEGDYIRYKTDSISWTTLILISDLKGDKGAPGDPGQNGDDGNGITSVTSSKVGKTTTVTMNFDEGEPFSFQVKDGEDGVGGNVFGPNSSTDGHLAVFDGATGKRIKDGGSMPAIPTKTSDLTNDSGFITGINSTDVTTALGYTPYNSTNPNGYVTNTIINDTAYGSSWDGDTTHSPTKNAVYDKINSIDTDISTINGKIPSAATSSNQLADKDYVNDGINSVTAYYITKNAQGDQWATRAELFAATTFYSGGVVRVPTKNDYTIVLDDENHDHATTRYIYNSGWEYQYTVNETALTQAQLDALNSGITSAKVSTYDGYASEISGKQDKINTITVTLASANWINNEITVTATGVTASNTVIVSPDPTSISDYTSNGVYCSAQGSGTLTFTCDTVPSNDIDVNVVILG